MKEKKLLSTVKHFKIIFFNLLIDFDTSDWSRKSHQKTIAITLRKCEALHGVVISACDQALLFLVTPVLSTRNRRFANTERCGVIVTDSSPDSDVSIVGSASYNVPKKYETLNLNNFNISSELTLHLRCKQST